MKKKESLSRYTALNIVMLLAFAAILCRLFYLQVIKYEDNKDLANNNSVRQLPEAAPRGEIKDKNGIVLATNVQSYNLEFMETDESKKYFFPTMDKVFKLLDSTGEKLQDDFKLKVNPFRLEFNTSDPEVQKSMELRFKKDRGFDFYVTRELYPNQKGDLTDDQKAKIDEELLKISPENAFYTLVKDYELYKLLGLTEEEEKALKKNSSGEEITKLLLEKYSLEELRKYMLVKDSLKMQSFSGFKPVTIASNIKREDAAFIFLQQLNNLPGVDVRLQPIRYYPHNELASSILGYIGSIDSGQKNKYEERGYDVSTDLIGKAGIESAFEDRLKGSKGGTTVKVNKQGRKTEELFKLEPYPGQNIQLTIDANIQSVAQQAMDNTLSYLQKNRMQDQGKLDTGNATRAAVVVSEVNTGKILALVSNPSYDPNIFAVPGRLTPELRKEYFAPDLKAFAQQHINKMNLLQNPLNKDSNMNKLIDKLFPLESGQKEDGLRKDQYDLYPKPFFNYATMGIIPPGSTFKPLTLIAGLEEGVIDPSTPIQDRVTFDSHGETDYKGSNDGLRNDGSVDVKKALEVSNNYFVYETGYRLYKKLGLNALAEYAWKFGLGVKPGSNSKSSTGIEIAENPYAQVFNVEKQKNDVIYYAAYGLVDLLNKGYYGNYKFKSLDISASDSDKEEVKKLKDDIKNAVKDKLKEDIKENQKAQAYKDLSEDLKKKIQAYINSLPEDQKKGYSKSDVNSMAYAIADYTIFDRLTQINTPANLFNASIGQGTNELTPLQLVNYIATLANGGTRYKTHLVDKIFDANGNLVEEVKPEVMDKIDLKPENLAAIKEGMRRVNAIYPSGSASSVFAGPNPFPIPTAGKTGTATYKENGVQESLGRAAFGVYVSFAPVDKPEIAVCVVIYDGGHGYLGAPVVRAIYEAYFKDRLQKEFPNYVPMHDYAYKTIK